VQISKSPCRSRNRRANLEIAVQICTHDFDKFCQAKK
jgi:hypothetical protein